MMFGVLVGRPLISKYGAETWDRNECRCVPQCARAIGRELFSSTTFRSDEPTTTHNLCTHGGRVNVSSSTSDAYPHCQTLMMDLAWPTAGILNIGISSGISSGVSTELSETNFERVFTVASVLRLLY